MNILLHLRTPEPKPRGLDCSWPHADATDSDLMLHGFLVIEEVRPVPTGANAD
jgi:hypothetical protein